jgi:uncharacterized protein YukE
LETKNLNIKINSESLNECAAELETIGKRIEDIFKNVDDIMSTIHDSDIWKGDTNEGFYNRYLELKKYFPKVNKGINTYANFLQETSSNYNEGEKQINSNISDNENSLDVNS